MPEPQYIESAVSAALLESADVAALCGERVYAVKVPPGVPLPVLVFQRISTQPDETLAGYSSESVVLAVKAFALDYEEAKQAALAVRAALSAPPLSGRLRDEVDLFDKIESEEGVYCIHAEYVFQQNGGYCYG